MADLWQIAGLLRPFWRRLLLALLLSVLTVGSGVGLMMVSAWLISMAALQLGIVSLGWRRRPCAFSASRALFRYLERLVSHDLTFRLLARLRVWFYERLEPLSLTQLQAYRRGDLIARVVSDIEELQNFYLRVAAPPLTAMIITALTGLLFSRIDGGTAVVLVAAMLVSGISLPLTNLVSQPSLRVAAGGNAASFARAAAGCRPGARRKPRLRTQCRTAP
jgi:ATP-binding cassette subfamily C protein CydC